MSRERTSEASPYRTATVEAGGHTFHLTEPDWRTAGRAVELYLPLIGDRTEVDAMVKALQKAVLAAGDDPEKRKTAMLEIIFDDDAVRAMDPEQIAELLSLVTTQDKEWFLEPGRLPYDAMVRLLTGVAEVLPFSSVLIQKGVAGLAFVNSWAESINESLATSGNGADGSPTTSPGTESDGATPSAETSTDGTPTSSSRAQ